MLAMFEHTQGISKVTFNKTITVFCPLGNDFYTAHVNVDFVPDKVMMDYLDEEAFFKGLSGANLIIEDLVEKVHKRYTDTYAPKYVKVTVFAENAAHFPVTVIKEN